MRVIAGKLKGRRLVTTGSEIVRPTADKVRESIFDILSPSLIGGSVLDLFAGTGGLGIEAVSRGMDRVVFIEHDSRALAVLRKNIAHCGIEQYAEVISFPVSRGLRLMHARKELFRLIFLDPPYQEHLVGKTVAEISEAAILAADGVVIAEHYHKEPVAPSYGRLVLDDQRRYGQTTVSFFINQS